MTPLDDSLRAALKRRYPAPNLSPYGLATTSWQAIDTHQGRDGARMEIARRDFIFTPLFVSLFTSFGLSAGAAQIAGTVLSAIAVTAISVGIQYLMAPKPPKPEDGRAPMTQAIPPQFFCVGEARLAGAYMLWESKGRGMYSVQAICGHPIDSFRDFYLHDDKVTIDPIDDGVVTPGNGRYGDGSPKRVKLFTRLGATPETPYDEIVAVLGGDGTWTNSHRGDGQASLGMICLAPGAENFPKAFPYGKPSASVVIRGARVWDFRDELQDPEDPSTWAWSDNPVLLLAWHECFSAFGTQRDFRTAILPVLDMWQEEADVCDELVPLAIGGTERRYTCGGFDTAEKDPKSTTNAILGAMDGWMCERGDGALLVVAGKFREKYVATLTDADVLGYGMQYNVLFEEEINRLIPTFTYPATDYSTSDTDYFEDIAAQQKAGRTLPQQANFPWVQQWRQARRLGKREWQRIQEKKRGQLYVRFSGINGVYAPWVRLQTPLGYPSLNGMLISNRKSVLDVMKGGFEMSFIKMPADIDAWVPATDEGMAPPVPTKPSYDGIPVAQIDTVAAIASGSSVILRVGLIDPGRDDLTPVIRYRDADIGGGVPGPWVELRFPGAAPDGGVIVLDTNPVPADRDLEVEANYAGANNSLGTAWSATEEVRSTIDATPPVALTTFSASDGTGEFITNFATMTDVHLSTVAIYKAPSGVPLDRTAHSVGPRYAVSPGIAYAIPGASAAGVFDIYAEPFNGSGVVGPLSGPDTATVT